MNFPLRPLLAAFLFILIHAALSAQAGVIRGNVFDAETGEPIAFGTVQLVGTDRGVNTDIDGFFSFGSLEAGNYTLLASYVGYDSAQAVIRLAEGEIAYQRLQLRSSAINLTSVNVSAERERARSDVQVSKVTVSSKDIRALPSTGGVADIAQYLPVLPGIVVSGDQGGQVYIRGGSPVQNKILLDGMTIYNPFHSIGLFSVFETETIRSVDVLTGGFNAEYGGRISAVVDIRTREGDKKKLSGLVSASPFQAKAIIEGPIKPYDPETGSSISFLLTGKHAYLSSTSKELYSYAVDTNFYNLSAADTLLRPEDIGLPFDYTDLYGKISIVGGNGSKLNLFGFNFTDNFAVPGLAELNWTTTGGGTNFNLVPPASNLVIDGTIAYSDYGLTLIENDGAPRSSDITSYNALLNFTYFGGKSQITYGFEFDGFNTDFRFRNPVGITFTQRDFVTQLAGYLKLKQTLGNLILEPGLRVQFYASQSEAAIEPRLGLKWNATDFLRFKAAGGLYSQNLISTVNDADIVNFFVGFLAGPEETIRKPDGTAADDRLQRAFHGVGGLELDLGDRTTINLEGYYKGFTQLIAINRNKLDPRDPDFVTETGRAYGGDVSLKYEGGDLYLWTTYSLGFVRRDDGQQVYPTSFDRRHNVNVLVSYPFGKNDDWELGARWNFGSAFPFTQTQGFYENVPVSENPVLTDILTGNFNLDFLLSEDRNGGRLADFHRLDLSLKRTFRFGEYGRLELDASVTNAYNRENIFYVDRVTNRRVNQLPILPSLALTYAW